MQYEETIEQIKQLSKQVSFQNKDKDGDFRENSLVLTDKNKDLYMVIPAKSLDRLFDVVSETKKEVMELKLEKTIWKYVPVDFADTWTVVMSKIKEADIDENANLNNIVKKVKKEYPNLFLNIDDFLPSDMRHLSND